MRMSSSGDRRPYGGSIEGGGGGGDEVREGLGFLDGGLDVMYERRGGVKVTSGFGAELGERQGHFLKQGKFF